MPLSIRYVRKMPNAYIQNTLGGSRTCTRSRSCYCKPVALQSIRLRLSHLIRVFLGRFFHIVIDGLF
jgi:hypothetical protein